MLDKNRSKPATQVPNPEDDIASMEQFTRDTNLLMDEWERLLGEFPNQWVAAYQGKIVAHSRSFDAVLKKLRQKGIPSQDTPIEFMDPNPLPLIV